MPDTENKRAHTGIGHACSRPCHTPRRPSGLSTFLPCAVCSEEPGTQPCARGLICLPRVNGGLLCCPPPGLATSSSPAGFTRSQLCPPNTLPSQTGVSCSLLGGTANPSQATAPGGEPGTPAGQATAHWNRDPCSAGLRVAGSGHQPSVRPPQGEGEPAWPGAPGGATKANAGERRPSGAAHSGLADGRAPGHTHRAWAGQPPPSPQIPEAQAGLGLPGGAGRDQGSTAGFERTDPKW